MRVYIKHLHEWATVHDYNDKQYYVVFDGYFADEGVWIDKKDCS